MSYNYNPSSQKAEEFINHEEILETLSYAEKNKNNVELIDQILAKARLRKGLSHREAAVLLDCEIPEKVEEIFELARQIKQDFYGNRIVMFAPLYLSNYCVNGCVYCPGWKLSSPRSSSAMPSFLPVSCHERLYLIQFSD